MSFIKNKKFIIGSLLILVLVIVGISTIFFRSAKDITNPDEVLSEDISKQNEASITIDFDGDGIGEILNVSEKEGVVATEVNMEVFDSAGNKIADLWDGANLYPTSLFKVIKLNENSEKQYLQWNMAVGAHQMETVFLTIVGDKVHPIYSFDFENNTMYSPFYTSRGEIVVEDANYDGLREVIENVDEYPVDAPRLEDETIDEMIREQFGDEGLDAEVSENMIKIVKRENSGKGRGVKVILAVHSFVDAEIPFFRRLPAEEYEEIVDL